MSGDIAEKARLRGERLATRDALTQAERQEKSQALTAHGASAIPFAPGAIISGFMPIRSEADIRPLMEALRTRGGRLVLPVVLDRETIVFRAFDADTTLVKTGFGTTGPGADADVLDPDILLVPLSVFDAHGQRIGYGAGHYDRAIARLHGKGRSPVLIGVAFDCQEVALVPAEPHDVPLDAILTESGLRWFSARRSMPDQGQKAL
ncbi:5-formyltetrahydrofolate cyclo-ligase [Agrobacterium genomosp. 3 str. CIP 111-78]|uniref:5-formyltetrahydrofolate cyclo-ligase n=1 Tax=Agrobacterium tumefaciens TaxID=358 RepID=A0AAE6BRE4_AGRTU|nr:MULTISPECIES: 5-formyltetrahydrofolate cyclo-ligase [Agrobacterium tumefaciens complex]MCA2372002.1 5-formyltetrahydrofolate cyclo-ligase [Agrobacterium tomkonis CIP 111-78]QCM02234.1 5-formyltetrahydrofolate cyclo-ligase [Agrobacterium tumefaciens]